LPKYKVAAKNLDNKMIKAVIDGRDEADLTKRLRDAGLTLIRFSEIEEKTGGYKLKANEVAEFSRQLASMLSSGITVARAMEIVKDRDFKPKIREVYTQLHKDVQSGLTLSEAMREQTAFPELFVNMMASGEASGNLEQSAEKMAVQYDKEDRLNKKVKSATMYPKILVVILVGAVLVLFTFILPQLFEMFEDAETIPLITRIVVGISEFLVQNWLWVIIGTLLFITVMKLMMKVHKIAHTVDKMKLKFPVVGKLLKIIYTARFSRTLSSLYSSGLSMTGALEISSTIMGNKYIQGQFVEVITDVRNGESLSESIGKVIGFDKKLTTSILIGEEAGRLDTMLVAVAESFDYEAEMATDRLVQLIQPVLLVFMAVVVGGVMLAVMMPIMSMYNTIA
jgi:type IV pilus assembly protein PilC